MFELELPTTAKLLDVVVLSQKNRAPDENPGAKLKFEVKLANDALSTLDGSLKSMLFTKAGGPKKDPQATLEGVEPVSDLPNLTTIGQKVGVLRWDNEQTGYTLAIDLGLGGKRSNIESDDCKVSKIRITPNEGGSINVKLNVEAPNVSEVHFGRLAKLKSRDVQLVLLPPSVDDRQADIGDPTGKPPFPAKGSKAHHSQPVLPQ